MTGIELIAAERKRQIEEEGFTAEYDDCWDQGQMVRAAMCYCMEPGDKDEMPDEWPWPPVWWKPSPDNRIHELKKAGALIAAEIDRLLRVKV